MKKLLILMLVLGMASIASAGYSDVSIGGATEVPVGGTAVITVSNSVFEAWEGFVDDSIGGTAQDNGVTMALVSVVATAKAGPDAGTTLNSNGYAVKFQTKDLDGGTAPNIETGLQWNITVDDGGLETSGSYTVYIYEDDYSATIGSVTMHVIVPEPMTIALLGLGGLFLRRRK